MSIYEFFFVFTVPIYLIAIYKLNCCFLGECISSKNIERSSYILYAIVLCIIFLNTRKPIVFLYFNLISFFIISLNYDASLSKRLVYIFLLYLFLFVIEAVIWRISGFFTVIAFKDSTFDSIVGIVLMRVFMLIFAHLLQKYKKSEDKNYKIPAYYYIMQFFILIGMLYFFLALLENKYITTTHVIISSIVVVLINGMIILVDDKIYEVICLSNEKNLLKQQNIAYEKQIEMINSSLSTIKALKHDMKNHIIALKLIHKNKQNQEFEEYSNRILSEIGNSVQFSDTENFIIDSIINFKLQELDTTVVDIKININIPNDVKISSFDLTTILGNLLDNAIRATKETTNDKKISLCMYYMKGNLVILIDNSYNGSLNVKNGIFLTTKHFEKIHGIGLKNVEKALQNYNGKMEVSYTDNIFSVAVLIPDTD